PARGEAMNCECVSENLVFYVYDELADDARHELEQHVERCQDCALELAAVKKFRSEVAQFPAAEPSPSLLASSRMKLQEALESAEQGGWWHRFIFDPVAWLHQIRFAPALAAAIFILGFAGGIGATYEILGPKPEKVGSVLTPPALASVSGISSI